MVAGVRSLHPAGGHILGVLLAEQGGHIRQDFFRSVSLLLNLNQIKQIWVNLEVEFLYSLEN